MNSLELLMEGFQEIFVPITFLYIVLGVFGGTVFGAIPGLTAALGVTLLLPFTYTMGAGQGISMLIAIYVGGISGGLVASVLLNIPGTPASLVTTFDGAPMARKGMPGQALSLGVFASLIGGLFSASVLIIIAPQLAKVALAFGPWEYFAMGIMGISIVVALASQNVVKGLIAATIGILFSTVGLDPITSVPRFTFGFWQLGSGFDVLATLMGLFALAEILTQLRTLHIKKDAMKVDKVPILPPKDMLRGKFKDFGVSSLIGTFVGILPGVGQTTASLLSYNQARQTSKEPEEFGKGHPSGVIASEAANNACCGGALVPMMTLGVPGDQVTAILIGGLVIHGLQPGPMLFTINSKIAGTMFAAYLVSCVLMFLIMILLMRVFIKVLKVPINILFPIILSMCIVGAITSNNRIFDCWVLLIIGVIGYVLINSGFGLPPLVLGFVLGPIIEKYYRLAVIASKGSMIPLFSRPIAMGLLLAGFLMLILPYVSRLFKKRRKYAEN